MYDGEHYADFCLPVGKHSAQLGWCDCTHVHVHEEEDTVLRRNITFGSPSDLTLNVLKCTMYI